MFFLLVIVVVAVFKRGLSFPLFVVFSYFFLSLSCSAGAGLSKSAGIPDYATKEEKAAKKLKSNLDAQARGGTKIK